MIHKKGAREAQEIAAAIREGAERAERAPALAAAKAGLNEALHGMGQRVAIDPEPERDEQGRFAGRGLDGGQRGGSLGAPEDTDMNARLRAAAGIGTEGGR